MADRLAASGDVAPRPTPAKIAAYAIALLVHGFTLLIVVTGIWLLFGDLVAKVGGVILLALAFLLRPRLAKRPEHGLIPRSEAPELYGLADEISGALGTRSVKTIAVSPEFNASWQVVGIRRERTLTLGLPLLAVLDHEEQVALIAHELAHARNGDATRGLVVGSAVGALAELHNALVPTPSLHTSAMDIAEIVVQPFLWLLRQPLRLLLLLEYHLLLQDGRRAEYLADQLAAQVAGPAAVVSLHEKLLLQGAAAAAVHQFAIGHDVQEGDAFDAIRAAVEDVPQRERERRRRVARLEETTLGDTHPPTGKRIAIIERLPPGEPVVRLDGERSAAVARELDAVRPAESRRLVDEYRAYVEY
jgi:Zn-dependent protease with chaperone function